MPYQSTVCTVRRSVGSRPIGSGACSGLYCRVGGRGGLRLTGPTAVLRAYHYLLQRWERGPLAPPGWRVSVLYLATALLGCLRLNRAPADRTALGFAGPVLPCLPPTHPPYSAASEDIEASGFKAAQDSTSSAPRQTGSLRLAVVVHSARHHHTGSCFTSRQRLHTADHLSFRLVRICLHRVVVARCQESTPRPLPSYAETGTRSDPVSPTTFIVLTDYD